MLYAFFVRVLIEHQFWIKNLSSKHQIIVRAQAESTLSILQTVHLGNMRHVVFRGVSINNFLHGIRLLLRIPQILSAGLHLLNWLCRC